MNPILDKFPPLLSLSLESRGFTLDPWAHNFDMNEDMRDFHHGTMQGLLGFKGNEIIVVAIINNAPHNGEFPNVMDKMEEIARTLELNIRVEELWNKSLMAHLISKRGYEKTGIDQVTMRNVT